MVALLSSIAQKGVVGGEGTRKEKILYEEMSTRVGLCSENVHKQREKKWEKQRHEKRKGKKEKKREKEP